MDGCSELLALECRVVDLDPFWGLRLRVLGRGLGLSYRVLRCSGLQFRV